MRQLTGDLGRNCKREISKLPMRQLTVMKAGTLLTLVSKLPMRQLTEDFIFCEI